MEDMEIKGRVNARAMSKGVTVGCFNKVDAIKGDARVIRRIMRRLKRIMAIALVKRIFLLLMVPSLTNFEILMGRANVARVINKE